MKQSDPSLINNVGLANLFGKALLQNFMVGNAEACRFYLEELKLIFGETPQLGDLRPKLSAFVNKVDRELRLDTKAKFEQRGGI